MKEGSPKNLDPDKLPLRDRLSLLGESVRGGSLAASTSVQEILFKPESNVTPPQK